MTRSLFPVMLFFSAACSATTPSTRPLATGAVSAPPAAVVSSEGDLCANARAPLDEFVRESEVTLAEGHARADAAAARAAWDERVATMRACHRSGTGAWILVPSELWFEWTEGRDVMDQYGEGYEIVATADWTFVDQHGGTHAAPESLEVGASTLGSHASTVSVLAVFDYDGDGAAELIAQRSEQYWEGSDRRIVMWSFAGGTVGPYAPAADIDLDQVFDFDHDGRPDLVSIHRYWSGTPCGMDPPPEGTPEVLFHSVPGGSFSPSDAVAAAYLRERCPASPARIFDGEEDCGGVAARHNIACARLWGASADAVRARMQREFDRLPDDVAEAIDYEWDSLQEFAAVEPPLSLATAAPAR